MSQVLEATPEHPYLSLRLNLDLEEIARHRSFSLTTTLESIAEVHEAVRSLAEARFDYELVAA
jgi:AraC-type transcriptional regulator N-terminus